MGRAVVCRGCGVRVVVPPGVTSGRARCPKCKTSVDLAAIPPAATGYMPKPAPAPVIDAQPLEPPLSLDDAEEIQPVPSLARLAQHPVPFRFAAKVVADSSNQLRGDFAVVLMPHGLYLESVPNKPFLFAPVRTPVEPGDAREVSLTLPDRVLVLRFAGVGDPEALATDTVSFLSGERPVPAPDEYRAAPARAKVLPILLAVVVGSAAAAGLLFAFAAWFRDVKPGAERVESPPVEKQPPAVEPPPTSPERPVRPKTHIDVAEQEGATRLDDGPADVTAVALSPVENVAVVGHADGATRVWVLDRPVFEGPHDGPRADGPVKRIQFSADGATVYLTCDGGFVAASRDAPPKTPVKLVGELVAVFPEAGAERFAALRNGRISQRLVPAAIVKNPSVSVPVKGFVRPVSTLEKVPSGLRPEVNPPVPRPTFLAWHPTGKLLAGTPSGEIVTWGAGVLSSAVTKAHTSAVTAWADAGGTWDFATGDASGLVGVWANKSLTPTTFRAGTGAVSQVALSYYGTHVAVLSGDTATVWTASGERVAGVPGTTKAVAFGPTDDLLMTADGKGVRIAAWAGK
ncbi:MAG TPA: hypothetical protein VMZ71_08720 [Gemmataceae bacterium]|nr:hypothetical protein [Gemmataceae bacterium]